MDLSTTLILGGIALAFAVFCGWRGARKPNPHKGPRLAPWRFMMMLSTALVMLLLLHLVHIRDA